jgi:phosphatidylglycerophosphate synthase
VVQLEALRAVVHPPGKLESRAEHWAGRLYMRKISLRLTQLLVGTRITPNQITVTMIIAGLLSGVALLLPGVFGALLAVFLMQAYLLLDCVDGEVARWRSQSSVLGVYLDRLGSYLADLAVMVGMGLRASGVGTGRHLAAGYVVLGLVAGIGVLLLQSASDLVAVARASGGLAAAGDQAVVPRSAGLARLRALAAGSGIHRISSGIECTFLLLAAALGDTVTGGLTATRVACAAVAAVVVVLVPAYFASIVSSDRLR